ncbi:MAG: RHS repeat-associated core domain-containing protein, partial [Bacteroidales bacterium]|nr:RHS repeat-associated core domain-containing protein [Bacteroidales bacterium]
RVLEKNEPDCITGSVAEQDELKVWIEGIPEQLQASTLIDYGEFTDVIQSLRADHNGGQEREVYFYHSDHLGSASWITDSGGQAIQHLQYLPYGEPYINQRTSGYNERFTFTGKERDEETGYGYFGARYMDYELMTMWLSVDPLADKYPGTSPYAYCAWSPIIAKDPNGMDSVRTPNGMANAGTGYKATPDGQYLYGEGLKTKRWNPDLVIGGVVGDGLRGGYEDWDMPSDIAAYVPCATCSETNSEFLMLPILPFMASSYDLLGNENFSGNIAIRGDGTLMYSNKEGFGKGLSWRNGKVLKNTSLGKVACKTTRMAKGAPALSIVTSAVDVTLNARQYGLNSRQTFGAFGGAASGIIVSMATGALIGGLPGAVIGFGAGIGASYCGERIGKKTFDWTH